MLLAELFKEVKYGTSKKGQKYSEQVKAEVGNFIDLSNTIMKTANELNISKKSELRDVIHDMTKQFNQQLKQKDSVVDHLSHKYVKTISKIDLTYSSEFKQYTKDERVLSSFRTSIDNVREVAEKLGLLIIPSQYVKQEMVEKEVVNIDGYNRQIGYSYRNFIYLAEQQNLNAWLVCPIQYYDIERHAKDLSYDFFIPSAINQAFTSIKIILPMLIGMINQIEALENSVSTLNANLAVIKTTLQEQQKQIDRLELELVKERQKRVEEAIRVRQLEEQVAQQKAQIRWATFDPIQIAIPSSVTDINAYEGNAVLGVAWGPEVDDLLVDLLGMQKQATRDNFIESQYNRFG